MEALEQISLFRDFFEQNCMDKILKASRIGKPFEIIFSNLSEFSLDLANELLDSPEETIKAAELALITQGQELSTFLLLNEGIYGKSGRMI